MLLMKIVSTVAHAKNKLQTLRQNKIGKTDMHAPPTYEAQHKLMNLVSQMLTVEYIDTE